MCLSSAIQYAFNVENQKIRLKGKLPMSQLIL